VIRMCPEKSADQNHNAGEAVSLTDHAQMSDKVSCIDNNGIGDRGGNKNESVAANEKVHEGGVSEASEQALLEDALDVDMTEDQSVYKHRQP